MNKKLVASLISIILLMQSAVYAADVTVTRITGSNVTTTVQSDAQEQNEKQEESKTQEKSDTLKTTLSAEDSRPVLTLDQAIEKGLENSDLFQEVKAQADIAKVVKDNSTKVRDDLIKAESDLGYAASAIENGRDKVYAAQNQLDSSNAAYGNESFSGEAFAQMLGVPFEGSGIPQTLTFTQASAILASKGITKSAAEIKASVRGQIDSGAQQLAASQKQLEASTQQYLKGDAEYQAAMKYALSSVTSKLSTSTISSLKAKPLGDLIVKMTAKQDEVTASAVGIYKNQIALLVEKYYFDALKQQELLQVKEKAEERGKVQYELAQAAYEVGAKAKDDMTIAKTYYDSTVMNTELQRKDYNEAMITLKKALKMDYDKDIRLEAVAPPIDETYDLQAGIRTGLSYRLEVKKAQAQKDVLEYLMTALEESSYESGCNQRKEVKLLQDQADLELKIKKADVEAEIRNSYSTLESMKKVVQRADELEAGAKATLENAKAKQEAGYSYSNSLLASLNLESMSGTVVEVLAAEENLINIQEKKIEAMNGYNLARLKYLNDTGVLPYK